MLEAFITQHKHDIVMQRILVLYTQNHDYTFLGQWLL